MSSCESYQNLYNQMNDLDKLVADTAFKGSREQLQKLFEQYPKHFKPHTMLAAVIGNQLENIKYMREIGVDWHEDCCMYAAERGHFGILAFGLVNRYSLFSYSTIAENLHHHKSHYWMIDWDNKDIRVLLLTLEAACFLPPSLATEIRMRKCISCCQDLCERYENIMVGLKLFCVCQFVYFLSFFYKIF